MEPTGQNILIVDDEIELANIIGVHLKILGYNYQIATSGEEALNCISKTPFDLIICDLIMPNMDGTELFAATRSRGYTMPFIFCSGLDESPFKEGLPSGVIAYLQKPFPMGELMDAISKFLLSIKK